MAAAAIILEDGSIVTGANSYATVAMLRQYADNYGVTTIPGDDAAAVVLLYKAMRYIESKEQRFSGMRACLMLPLTTGMYPVSQTQPLAWPRACARENSRHIPATEIPLCLISAQCQLACDTSAGVDLMPTVAGSGNLKVKVRGPIKDEYFAPGMGTVTLQLNLANALLNRLYSPGAMLNTVRA